MDEFAKACEIHLDLNDFIINSLSNSGQMMTTTSLYNIYARRVAIRQLELYPLWMQGGLPSVKSLVAWIMAKLGFINPNNMADQDDSRDRASLGILWQRLIACRICTNGGKWRQSKPGPTEGRVKFAECIACAQRTVRTIMAQHNPIVRFEIVVSIDVLCQSLVEIINIFLDEHIELPGHSQDIKDNFETAMIARNWCPSRLLDLQNVEDIRLAYIISLLPSYETVSHRGCGRQKCLIRPSTAEAMTGQHQNDCDGGCLSVPVDESQLINMWKRGGIPGLRQVKGDRSAEFEVVDCNKQPFVAMSHVWSHGLGNPFKNELPSCQVGFLFNLVEQVAGSDAILWIDTLSVPIEPDTKRIAISKLRTVYTEASKALVIDKDLMHVGSDENEQILQLLSSEWQRRLWTLQEGRLARHLHIQFKDGAVSISKLIAATPLWRIRELNTEISNVFIMINVKLDIRNRFSEKENIHSQFLELVEDLARRSVTVKSDESLCLATLLGLQLEDFDPYSTMVDIYRSLQSIPQDLMFRRQPRLQAPGLTWAPSTFLEAAFLTFPSDKDSRSGRLSGEGLHVVRDSLLFNKDLKFRRNPSSAPEVYIVESSDGQTFALQSVDFVSPDGTSTRVEPSRLISKPAVIWMKTTSTGQFKTTSAAILVSRLYEKGGVTYCRFEMDFNGWRVGEAYEDSHKRYLASSGGIIENVLADFVAGKSLCVG